MTSQRIEERRTRERDTQETRVTMMIQTILADPPGALELLERELKEGVAPAAVTTALDLAARTVRGRGQQLTGSAEWIRERLARSGYRV